jgi:hypothetical protein
MTESGTVTVSLRINPSLREILEREATRRHMSLNAYASDCLGKSVEWDTMEEAFDFAHVSKTILAKLLQETADKEIAAIARQSYTPRLRDLAYAIYGEADLEGLKRVLELTAKYEYQHPITYSWHENSNSSYFFLRHGISEKWSRFLAEGYLGYLETLGIQASYETTINSLRLTIPRKMHQQIGALQNIEK